MRQVGIPRIGAERPATVDEFLAPVLARGRVPEQVRVTTGSAICEGRLLSSYDGVQFRGAVETTRAHHRERTVMHRSLRVEAPGRREPSARDKEVRHPASVERGGAE